MIQANVFLMFIVHRQGDQIGRIFAQWAIIYFGQFLKITEVAHILCCKYKGCINFVQKRVGRHFGRFLSKPRLVTLFAGSDREVLLLGPQPQRSRSSNGRNYNDLFMCQIIK
jgi:hypothetical protein